MDQVKTELEALGFRDVQVERGGPTITVRVTCSDGVGVSVTGPTDCGDALLVEAVFAKAEPTRFRAQLNPQ